jgi:hypothetical protein
MKKGGKIHRHTDTDTHTYIYTYDERKEGWMIKKYMYVEAKKEELLVYEEKKEDTYIYIYTYTQTHTHCHFV